MDDEKEPARKGGIKKQLIIFAGVLGTILLGAIGSGLWERCLSKLLDTIVIISVRAMSLLFKTYESSLYTEAAKGLHEESSIIFLSIFLSMMPFIYLIFLLRHPYKRKEQTRERTGQFFRSRIGYYTLMFMTFFAFFYFMLFVIRINYVNKVSTFCQQSLAIIAPHTSEDRIKRLRADYHSMRNKEDFTAFRQTIQSIVEESDFKLPEFKQL